MSIRVCRNLILLLLVVTPWATYAQTPEDPAAPTKPPATDAIPDAMLLRCNEVRAYMEKWAPPLGLADWKFNLFCTVKAPWEEVGSEQTLRGSSITDPESKHEGIWVNQNDPAPEHVVIHELLHAVVQYTVKSSSALVNENTVLTLANLLNAYDRALRRSYHSDDKAMKALHTEGDTQE